MHFSQFYEKLFPVYEKYVVQFACKSVRLSSFFWDIKKCVKKTDKTDNVFPKCKENLNDNQCPFLSIEQIFSINY